MNKGMTLLSFISLFLLFTSVVLMFIHTPCMAALSAQIGVAGITGWTFLKELFY